MRAFLPVRLLVPVLLFVALCTSGAGRCCAQNPPPPPPPKGPRPGPPHPPPPLGPHPAERLPELQRRFARLHPVNAAAVSALHLAHSFLDTAERAAKANQPFLADRYAAAADAQMRIADHQQHLASPGPAPVPPRQAIADHLEHVYFRLQQANYFLSLTRDTRAAQLPQSGRAFYEKAVQAYDRHDDRTADELAKCVDDTVKTLEELAQAAHPMPAPPPNPPPPPPNP